MRIPSLKKNSVVSIVLLVLSCLLIVVAETFQSQLNSRQEKEALGAEKNLRMLEEKMEKSLEQVTEISGDSAFHQYFIHHGFQKLGFSFFYIEHETITKWSDNETEISSKLADTSKTNSLIHLNNGWYEFFVHKVNNKEIIGLILIRKEYAYENQYLVNGFNPELRLPADCELTGINNRNAFAFRSISNEPLFAIRFLSSTADATSFGFKSWLYLFSFFLFLFALFLAAKTVSKFSSVAPLVLVAVVAAARTWMIHLHVPGEFYNTAFFSPQLYASSFYFNSLGDLFINTMLILCFSAIFYSVTGHKIVSLQSKTGSIVAVACSLLVIFFLSIPLDNLIRGLILNSRISFDVGNIFSMNEDSLTGIVVIAALLCSYFLVALAFVRYFFRNVVLKKKSLLTLVFFAVFGVISLMITSPADAASLISPLILALTIALVILFGLRMKKNDRMRLNFLLGFTFLFSVYTSFLMWKMNERKEKENRKLLAQKIEVSQDQIAEYLFDELGSKIQSDEIIRRQFNDTSHVQELVSKRLMQFYFTGYWAKYNITISCFDRNSLSFDTLQTKFPVDSLGKKMISEGNPDDAPQIHYINNEHGQQQYVAFIPVRSNEYNSLIGSIEIVLVPKLYQTAVGFPELFVSNKVAYNKELADYSYARYKNDSLLNQSGVFSYYFSLLPFKPTQQEYSFIQLDGYNHLVYRANSSVYIVVSKSASSSLLPFTLFSYLLSMFSLLLLLFYFVWRFMQRDFSLHLSLTRRIQFSVMMLVILSFVLTGTGTMYYMVHKYDVNQDNSINEKTGSLLAVMEKELGDAPNLKTKLSDETQASLIRLSGTMKADFNIYHRSGNLYYSSQPKIFEQGIISRKMNPDALFEISEKGKTQFVHPESIGRLNYIAAYEPLRNRQGRMIGYLHLPYFEKQNELNREISNFLSALINIYVLLFALAVLVTFFISTRITHPLLLIQEKLSSIRLGRKNELIEYRQRDEIGELVNEYNRMVQELAASAEKLSRSERESAWREMAKQVAHEIKNPLTPMKLSLQHLQKAWEEKSPALNEIFQRISQTLVIQIDALSTIATEFSNFAQMPPAKKEIVDLTKILEATIELFKEEPDMAFQYADDHREKFVFADKDQLIRVFSNLLKNAIQAIPSGQHGIIQVTVSTVKTNYMISIRDNGVGIAPEQRHRIFTPSFTTKSGGMGLGLSIVKSIVESSGGSIWFDEQNQPGTTFYITLPIANLSN